MFIIQEGTHKLKNDNQGTYGKERGYCSACT